ncbi:hypothetical protein [Novosphingopyxis sp. YJ-S2-01]|uniref:hypothetical protein n=1 Tax=Novosphingopyxis sp. YJ-S2-01 TaxID=2794021 RepID=UPI0018DE0788|nr:hypothetical protein [Novosphingopyxis sp. YJ-S2-01]MBH9537808.1 hypothetical protein [Novosphingopyxis sp. YJ-S2-01]
MMAKFTLERMVRGSYKIYRAPWLDIFFGIATAAFLNVLIQPHLGTAHLGAAALIVAGGLIAASVLGTALTGLDRRFAEDYSFRLMSQAALAGNLSTFFAIALWIQLFGRVDWLKFPDLNQGLATLLGSWSLCYLFLRVRTAR